MKLCFISDFSCYSKDALDVVRLFYPDIDFIAVGEASDITIFHSESFFADERKLNISIKGLITAEYSISEPYEFNAFLENKRVHKRQLKRCIYHALEKASNKKMPWGSLTGVRPTGLVYDRLEKGMSIDLALEDMKKLFSVSDEKLSLLRKTIENQLLLPKPSEKQIDIYVGIPYCPSKCRYCSFISSLVPKQDEMQCYVDTLIFEIEKGLELIDKLGFSIRAFYMGGGTPTSLSDELFDKLLKSLELVFNKAGEVTIEAGRPDTINRFKLEAIKEAGIKRISINPQTMHDTTLEIIGRKHTREQAELAYELAREIKIPSINMDLIAGLPYENQDMFEQSLSWAKRISPESITIHSLSVKRGSNTHLFGDKLSDSEMVTNMLNAGIRFAEKNSYKPYYLYRQKNQTGNLENIGFSKPNHECLYNIDMMEENISVFSFGAGAISKAVSIFDKKITRCPNIKQPRDYIIRIDEIIARKHAMFEQLVK